MYITYHLINGLFNNVRQIPVLLNLKVIFWRCNGKTLELKNQYVDQKLVFLSLFEPLLLCVLNWNSFPFQLLFVFQPLLIQFRLFNNGCAVKGTLLVNKKVLSFSYSIVYFLIFVSLCLFKIGIPHIFSYFILKHQVR